MSAEPQAQETPSEPQDQESRLSAALARVVAEDARQGAPAEPSDEAAEGADAGPPAVGAGQPPAAAPAPAPAATPEIDWRAEALRHRDANARIGQELAELRQAKAERDRIAAEAEETRAQLLRVQQEGDEQYRQAIRDAQDPATRAALQAALDARVRDRTATGEVAQARREAAEERARREVLEQQLGARRQAEERQLRQQMYQHLVGFAEHHGKGELNLPDDELARWRGTVDNAEVRQLFETLPIEGVLRTYHSYGNWLERQLGDAASRQTQAAQAREERVGERNRQEAVATAPQLPKGGGGGAEPVDLARFRGTGDTMGAYRAMKEAGQL